MKFKAWSLLFYSMLLVFEPLCIHLLTFSCSGSKCSSCRNSKITSCMSHNVSSCSNRNDNLFKNDQLSSSSQEANVRIDMNSCSLCLFCYGRTFLIPDFSIHKPLIPDKQVSFAYQASFSDVFSDGYWHPPEVG